MVFVFCGCRSPVHPFRVDPPMSHLDLVYVQSAGGLLKPRAVCHALLVSCVPSGGN